jgi:hypothetical protein
MSVTVLVTSLSHHINAVNAIMMTAATSNAMRMHYRHCYRHSATEVLRGGAEKKEKAEKAEKKIVNAVMLYITVSNSHYYPIS